MARTATGSDMTIAFGDLFLDEVRTYREQLVVYAGPIFSSPLALVRGERVLRNNRFEYCDLLLAQRSSERRTSERQIFD